MKKKSILATGFLCATLLFPQLMHAHSILFGASLFTTQSNNVDFFRDSTILCVSPGSVDRLFTAPVFLPNGARVTSVVLFFKDNSPELLQVEMKRLNIYHNYEEIMFSRATKGNTSAWRRALVDKIAHNQIKNNSFLYHLSVWFSEGQGRSLALRAIKINYDLAIN